MEWLLVILTLLHVVMANSAWPSVTISDEWKAHTELVIPKLQSVHPLQRVKRSPHQSNDERILLLKTEKGTFYVSLKANEKIRRDVKNADEICHFHGTVLSHEGGIAALSTCGNKNKMMGFMIIGPEAFVLRPLEHAKNEGIIKDYYLNSTIRETGAHVLVKLNKTLDQYCGTDDIDMNLDLSHPRLPRSAEETTSRKVIEVAVFVDYPLYNKLSTKRKQTMQDIRDTALTIINEVELIYNYQTMRTKFKIVVVNLEIITVEEDGPNGADGDIDQYLENFCAWQSLRNPESASELHWDHAIMLSGHDLHKVIEKEKNQKVLGLAWVNGMCRPKLSCTVNEGSSFEGAFVIAHEMGHSLGMMHDGRGNDCDPSGFLMSAKTGPGRITWSSCSNDYVERFFQKGYGSCLSNDNDYTLEPGFDSKLPGQRFDLEAQCKLSLGNEFKPHIASRTPFNNVCSELWCASGLWASMAHPALEGSTCGKGKHCSQGKCIAYESASIEAPPNAAIVEDMKGAVAEFLEKLKMAFHRLVS